MVLANFCHLCLYKMPEDTQTKIIFLDFDVPVTNRLTALFTGSAFDLNPVIIGILNQLCAVSGAKLVCSSNRADLNDRAKTIALLTKAGFDCDAHLHPDWSCNFKNTDIRPPDKEQSALIRTENILAWLTAHPEVDVYAALDDLPLTLNNFVQVTDRNNGVSFENIQKLCYLLGVSLGDIAKAANPMARERIKFPEWTP